MSESSKRRGAKPTRRAVLPEVTGMHLDDARVVLTASGFDEVRVKYVETYEANYDIVKQTPGSGIMVDRGREILLEVSRMNLVNFLPSVYQQTSATNGQSFIRGFLYIVQTLADQTSRRLDRLDRLFDPRTTDPEFLPWLASWLAIGLNRDWSELQARQMLLAATRLFPYRGTAMAIEEFVRIYTGASVDIEENTWPFKGFKIGVHSTVGEDTVILPTMNLSHCFVVRLDRPAIKVPEDEIIRIHQIIQAQKPAHAAYFLAFRDEEEKGEMGAFMTIAGDAGDIGGAVGMGIGVAPEPAIEEVGKKAEKESKKGESAKSGKNGEKAKKAKKAKKDTKDTKDTKDKK